MSLELSFILLTVILASLVLVLALSLLRLSLGKEKSEKQKSVSDSSEIARSETPLVVRNARLLKYERAPELLADLAEQFEKDFNLEFAEFTLARSNARESSSAGETDSKLRRIDFADGLTGSFRWKERAGDKLSEKRIDEVAATARAYVANLNRLQEYKRQAILDPLTGLFNAAYFRTRLAEEVKRAKRSGGSLGLMVIDLDNFKQINDTHGHPVGDEVLSRLAELLRQIVRSTDIVARYGGDELCVILPDSDIEQTQAFMTRLHHQVRKFADTLEPARATISIGAAVAPEQAGDSQSLFKAADDALLEAKRKGRNRAVMYAHKGAAVT